MVTVGKNTVEQTVIGFAAQVGERRQIGRLKPATLATADVSGGAGVDIAWSDL